MGSRLLLDDLERTGFLSSILKNLRSFHGNETARHHAVKHRQETVDFLLRVDDLNHDRQILRQAQKLGSAVIVFDPSGLITMMVSGRN
jgi:hypothetical protein